VSCIFCGAVSPHNVPNCLKCSEAFAGAAQRKAAAESQRDAQQAMQVVSAVGPLLGVALGVALSRDWDD
jgi:phage tail tape-measure protein